MTNLLLCLSFFFSNAGFSDFIVAEAVGCSVFICTWLFKKEPPCLINTKMKKGVNSSKPRDRKKLSVTLISLFCLALVVLIWGISPHLSSFFPLNQARFDIVYPEAFNRTDATKHGKSDPKPIQHPRIHIADQLIEKIENVSDAKQNRTQIYVEDETAKISGIMKADKSSSKPAIPKQCNYSKGRWLPDKRRPLYSGLGCKNWLSPMWACRTSNRTNFSFENFRWQPEGCEMPEFHASTFLNRMKDKMIAFVGDSLGRQQFQSLMCMATQGKKNPEVEDVGHKYGLRKASGAARPNGWAFRFPRTNTTILFYWSATLCSLEPINVSGHATAYAMHLDRPVEFLKKNLPRLDVLVLNTGHHWNRGKFSDNHWVTYVGGVPSTDKKLAAMWRARNFAVGRTVGWLESQLPRFPHVKAFFRTLSPRHFVNGDWNTGGRCDNTVPLATGSEVSVNVSGDPYAQGALRGTRLQLLDITQLSWLRDEAHVSKFGQTGRSTYDCLHWCLPGVPDTWNEILVAQM